MSTGVRIWSQAVHGGINGMEQPVKFQQSNVMQKNVRHQKENLRLYPTWSPIGCDLTFTFHLPPHFNLVAGNWKTLAGRCGDRTVVVRVFCVSTVPIQKSIVSCSSTSGYSFRCRGTTCVRESLQGVRGSRGSQQDVYVSMRYWWSRSNNPLHEFRVVDTTFRQVERLVTR